MFRSTAAIEPPAPVEAPPAELIPLSVLALDLGEPVTGWDASLAGRGIEIVLDHIGRDAISSADARQLLDEQREAAARAREVAAQQEQAAIAADQAWRSQLWRGAPWYEVPYGVRPAEAMLQAARDEAPRKRSMVEDLLDRNDTMVFHPMQGDES